MTYRVRGNYKSVVDKIEQVLKKKQRILSSILTTYEVYWTAEDEINRSISALSNIDIEQQYLVNSSVQTITSFLPLNLPLYSLILFGVIPSLICEQIHLRPPVLMRNILENLIEVLRGELPTNIHIHNISRNAFVNNFVKKSDVVIFTGKSDNALDVQKKMCYDSLFICNGSGANPFVIGPQANIQLAVEKSINARTYNSGQDCAGPDRFFVHKSIYKEYLDLLISQLKLIIVGGDIHSMVGKLIDPLSFDVIKVMFSEYSDQIVYKGFLDSNRQIISPTVIEFPINEKNPELFAPIFLVTPYTHEADLDAYFESKEFQDYAMYISIFGEISPQYYEKLSQKSVLLMNQNVLDYEQGNKPFGGYGAQSSYVVVSGKKTSKPILISREIHEFTKFNGNGRYQNYHDKKPR